jgi:hypothetical protein
MVIKNKSNNNIINNIRTTLHIYFSNYNKAVEKFAKKHNIKLSFLKILSFIIVFIIIFDKATILLILYLFNKLTALPIKTENYSNALVSTVFEPSNNSIHLMSTVFKHPELNLKSYTNVKIDPTKVLFEDNKFLPECCFYNSEYSTSKGCPCITGDQQNYLSARGTNKSYISFIQTNNDYKNKFFSPTLAFQGTNNPFKTNDEHYIIDHEPLAPEKKTEFNSLINNY